MATAAAGDDRRLPFELAVPPMALFAKVGSSVLFLGVVSQRDVGALGAFDEAGHSCCD